MIWTSKLHTGNKTWSRWFGAIAAWCKNLFSPLDFSPPYSQALCGFFFFFFCISKKLGWNLFHTWHCQGGTFESSHVIWRRRAFVLPVRHLWGLFWCPLWQLVDSSSTNRKYQQEVSTRKSQGSYKNWKFSGLRVLSLSELPEVDCCL